MTLRFRRFKAADVREILAAGPQAPNPVRPGNSLTTLEEFKIQLSSVPQATFDSVTPFDIWRGPDPQRTTQSRVANKRQRPVGP